MITWGQGWSSWLNLCAVYAIGPDGCQAVKDLIETNASGGVLADACPNGLPGQIMGADITCFGVTTHLFGVTTAPTSSVHSLPGPPNAHAQVTFWIACGG